MGTIYTLTLRELVRRKALLLTLVLVAVHLTCYGLGLHFSRPDTHQSMGNPMVAYAMNTQFLGFAIYTAGFISAFFAIFAASGAIAAEVESGILHSIVPKPVSRWEILAGKFLGYATGCALFSCILLSAIIVVSQAITGQRVDTRSLPEVFGLFCLQPIPLLSVTMLASVFLPAISAGIGGAMVFMVGITGGMMEQIGKLGFPDSPIVKVGMWTSLVSPMDAIYRVIYTKLVPATMLGDLGPFGAASSPRPWTVAYAAVYIVVVVALAGAAFRRRDL